ncbi:hypothetical protein U8335_21745 [Roseiconus lacunae]|uniref:hypothetical protein n=1 Tax=Roseiconus lacunae TaxID=2605694 RepID=UPI003088FACB|nr:hypothetical protein U8335_21745 [Stieleria sp. HD01]
MCPSTMPYRMSQWGVVLLLFIAAESIAHEACADDATIQKCRQQFADYTGAEVVFSRDDLPPGRYHDILKPLAMENRLRAVEICLEEAKLYPPGYFAEMGLTTIGVFAVCASKRTSDDWREFDRQVGGYRYYGIYNGTDALAAAFYSDGQLALTLHHEIFHHVDSTVDGETGKWNLGVDDFNYRRAIEGAKPYTAAAIAIDDLKELRGKQSGYPLQTTVSAYAAKNLREDQAETARHFMSMMKSSLVQIADQPELPGSQRILHILREYESAVPDGPGIDWFVNTALQRNQLRRNNSEITIDATLLRLRDFAHQGERGYTGVDGRCDEARMVLRWITQLPRDSLDVDQCDRVFDLAASVTVALTMARLQPDESRSTFLIWGREDSNGVNQTLRRDVRRIASDCERLYAIANYLGRNDFDQSGSRPDGSYWSVCLSQLRLLSEYYVFIDRHWSISEPTEQIFSETRNRICDRCPPSQRTLAVKLRATRIDRLKSIIENQ